MLENILNSFNLSSTNITLFSFKQLIHQEKFRKNPDLESIHLLQLIELLPNFIDKINALETMLTYVNLENPQFSQLCNACFLAILAQKDVAFAKMILNNETCLEIFLNDVSNFSSYFLAIAEKHTYFMYKYLRDQIQDTQSKHYQLFKALKADKSFRAIYSQLLSYADNFFKAAESDELYYFIHVTDSFGKREALLLGDDANANLKIICRSKHNANDLLITIFANKFSERNSYAEIEISTLIEISKLHPEFCHITINALQSQLNNLSMDSKEYAIYQTYIAELMPLLQIQADKAHSPSVHLVAECILLNTLSHEQDPASILINHYEKYQDITTLDQIFHLAQAYIAGEFKSVKISQDIATAYFLLTYLTTKPSEKNSARELLAKPSFALQAAKAAQENGDLKLVFSICQNARAPEKPRYLNYYGMDDVNKRKTLDYAQDMIAYVHIKHMELSLSKTFLEEVNIHSAGTLKTVKKLDKKTFSLVISKLLLSINTNILTDEDLHYCLDIALHIMGNYSDQRTLACKLLQHISDQSKQATNFLACFDQTLKDNAKTQLYDMTRVEILEVFLKLNETFSQLVHDCAVKAQDDIDISDLKNNKDIENQYQGALALENEMLFLNKQIRQEILHLQNPEQYPDKMWSKDLQRKLPVDLQNEIKNPHALRSAQHSASFWTSEPLKLTEEDDFDCNRIIGSSFTPQN